MSRRQKIRGLAMGYSLHMHLVNDSSVYVRRDQTLLSPINLSCVVIKVGNSSHCSKFEQWLLSRKRNKWRRNPIACSPKLLVKISV